MRRRDLAAAFGLVLVGAFVAGLTLLDFHNPGVSPAWGSTRPPGLLEVGLRWFVRIVGGLLFLGVVLLLVHQYVRWKPYRPAIHLAVALIVFVSTLAWMLGPVGIGSAAEGLTADETQLIRVAGAGLLFFLILFVARMFDGSDGEAE